MSFFKAADFAGFHLGRDLAPAIAEHCNARRDAEIERLRDEFLKLDLLWSRRYQHLKDDNTRLREALEFYADEANYFGDDGALIDGPKGNSWADRGQRARAALGLISTQQEGTEIHTDKKGIK